ncbi:MAG: hypothetical protein ACYC69_00015 [Thermodesulfovibrionales bacterium]
MKKLIVLGSIFALLLSTSYGVAQMNTGHGGGMMDGGWGWGWGMGYGWGFGLIIAIAVILVVVFMMKRK